MKSDAVLGAVLGALLAGVSVAGNVWRGDPHLAFTDVNSLLIVPAFLFIVLRRRQRAGMGRDALKRSGRIIVTISAALFAVLLAAFATFWFSDPWANMIAMTLAATFASNCIIGYTSVEVSARVLTRAA